MKFNEAVLSDIETLIWLSMDHICSQGSVNLPGALITHPFYRVTAKDESKHSPLVSPFCVQSADEQQSVSLGKKRRSVALLGNEGGGKILAYLGHTLARSLNT